jgi:hypothetical protein
MLRGDIWTLQEQLLTTTISALNGEELFLIYANSTVSGHVNKRCLEAKGEVAAGNRHGKMHATG